MTERLNDDLRAALVAIRNEAKKQKPNPDKIYGLADAALSQNIGVK